MGKSKQEATPTNQNTTTTVNIPDFLRGPLQNAVGGLTDITSQQPQVFPGQTTVPFAPESALALDLQRQAALQGSPLIPAASQQLFGLLQGGAMGGPGTETLQNFASGQHMDRNAMNQQFQDAFRSAAGQIVPNVQSQFEMAGRTGSGLADVAQTQALSGAFGDVYSRLLPQMQQQQLNAATGLNQFRQGDIGQLMGAIGAAPGLADARYADIGRLSEVGAARENMTRQAIQEQLGRFGQLEDTQRQRYLDLVNALTGVSGATSGQTTQGTALQGSPASQSSPLTGAMGGALTGAKLGSIVPGLGTGVGAIGGGILGLLAG